jgi:uncharacterized protein
MSAVLLAGIGWLNEIGRSLREGFFMFWETLWPLILGFAASGAVQAFVSHEAMQRKLGDHTPKAVLRASGYGVISSSCSYAASAMAKSLFVKGADFVSSLVFMVASTNLVIELGIVLVVLMGWQFAASEFVGGIIMVVLLAASGGLWFRGKAVAAARRRLADDTGSGHDHDPPENFALQHEGWRRKLRSKAGWADAATYTMSDLTMLRRELVIGYVVAGFLTVVVPSRVWNALLLHGHGFWTSAENVVVGPLIAILSFVCSIGNVPLAAALWKGGISFGGVVSFVFADLITFPLLLVYHRYYGTRLTLRMLALLWAVIAVAALATEAIFRGAGLVPRVRPTRIAPERFSWNYTSYLNLTFLLVFALLYWIYRNRLRLGGGRGYALDPVCGMQVEVSTAPASLVFAGEHFSFCSDRCRTRFEESRAHVATGPNGSVRP